MSILKTARIPVPGIVFGSYPERRAYESPSVLTRLIMSLTRRGRSPQGFVATVRGWQQQVAGESTQVLSERVTHLRARLAREGFLDAAVAEAFAVVAVCCRRELGVELYDTQLIAARSMLDGYLAEMATGEGKTLAAAVTASVAALAGVPVHVVTANDYLVARDASYLRPLYHALGLSVGAVTQPLNAAARQSAYASDITYCAAKELVFDYLRDGVAAPRHSTLEQAAAALAGAAPQPLLRGLCMAIVDEADSILIDEARVPLILSQQAPDTALGDLPAAWQLSATLKADPHFHLDPAARSTQLTAAGREHLRQQRGAARDGWLNARHCEDMVTLALTARYLLQRGRDFVVEDGCVHIIDQTTGRKAQGRSWSGGLHQLVEIKAGCAVSARVETLAQITYQCFFPRYHRLCGMSGTLTESRRELHKIYALQVVKVPLQRPSRRTLLPPRVFPHAEAQWSAVVARVRALHEQGRPVLVGTDSVLASERLSQRLAAAGLMHVVLNAQQDRHEADIIAAAGALQAITVATNMAGRGTDIMLTAASRDAGGLHVLCCQQNTARRIDRQLLGRCARQGDPGSAEYFMALDGPLLGIGAMTDALKKLFKNKYLRNINGMHWEQWALRSAQRAAERRHAAERELLMRRDQRMNDWLAFSGREQ